MAGEAEAVTAAVLVIGDEILSGRTQDQNSHYIAKYLADIGVDMREIRVVPDVEAEIVAAVNALRARYAYVFTTGGIGPTHDDITADAIARAFGVGIEEDPRAIDMLLERIRPDQLNEARRRMARIPLGADLIENSVSKAPGFMIGNVIVMAGVPMIMRTMLDAAAPRLRTGARVLVETIEADAIPEGRYAKDLAALAARFRGGEHRLLSAIFQRRRAQPDRAARARRFKARRGGGGHAGNDFEADRQRREGVKAKAMQKILAVSWDRFHADTRTLAHRLAAIGGFSAIAAVTRGGLIPAGVVARELGIRVIDTICVASYHEETTRGEIAVLKSLSEELLARPAPEVLIVDDLVDTGATAKIVRALLPGAHFATVYAKSEGLPQVDTYVHEVAQETWIYFPWDTALSFQEPISARRNG